MNFSRLFKSPKFAFNDKFMGSPRRPPPLPVDPPHYYYNFYGPDLHSDVTHAQKEEVTVKKADLQEMIKEKMGESFEFVDKGKWRQKNIFPSCFH